MVIFNRGFLCPFVKSLIKLMIKYNLKNVNILKVQNIGLY
ncbi:hypothetical protein ELI_4161 [Eubacterium callanderi]|uniref:Uncharacterized protein n=1 Tax=Eubacterium callanderi TaxID=53442 RepID=E3GQ54_9FIRM|nr:hypothetical protein ELI_4161 [Eubacterium callanderi]